MSRVVSVGDASAVGAVRRAARVMGERLAFSEESHGVLALIATEAATNVVRHAGQGMILLRAVDEDGSPAVELVAVDKGPGIANVDRALRDGFSTAGSAGTGLGAIRRLASSFDLYTRPGAGTVLTARVVADVRQPPVSSGRFRVGAVCVPYPGETACGDAWLIQRASDGEGVRVTLVDGLGHGPDAARAAMVAVHAIAERGYTASLTETLQLVHAMLHATRGAAVGMAAIDRRTSTVQFAGVGNIAGSIVSAAGTRSLASQNGTVGHEVRRFQEFTYEWSAGASLIMHTDGVSGRWRVETYPGMTSYHPSIAAALLHRDWARANDDATIVVVSDGNRG
jgi:anti-sigma regulatory factor (Ser/Thr protein kinase)